MRHFRDFSLFLFLMCSSSVLAQKSIPLFMEKFADIQPTAVQHRRCNLYRKNIDDYLIDASAMGDLDKAKKLLIQGARVNYSARHRCTDGKTALIAAAKNGHLNMAQWLVAQGAYLDTFEQRNNHTALHYAAQLNHLELVKWFVLKQGLSVNWVADNPKDIRFGKTPLHAAAQGQALPVIRWLVEHGADIKRQTKQGETPLSFSVYGYAASPEKNKDTITYFLKRGVDIKKSKNIMLYAAWSNDLQLVQYFARRRANIHEVNYQGATSLQFALRGVRQGAEPVVARWLIDQGVNVSYKDSFGNTALHDALWLDDLPLIQRLIEKGAIVNTFNNSDKFPLEAAFSMEHWHIARWLIENQNIDANQTSPKRKNTLLYAALQATHKTEDAEKIAFIKWLVHQQDADVNAVNKMGETPLFYTMHTPRVRQWLSDHGADIDQENKRGETLLFKAVKEGALDTIDWLFQKGLNVAHSNKYKQTALHIAINQYSLFRCPKLSFALVRKLVELGVPLNTRNIADQTALFYAKKYGLSQVVDYLIAQGAEE